ncbi:MFS transporter [Chloroflexota bacterium]
MPSLAQLKEKIFYGWVLTIAGVVILASTLGVRHSFGVFFKSIELEFSLSRGATSSIFSIYMILCAAMAILGGWMLDRYGPRIAAISFGLFTGLSSVLTANAGDLWQLFISYSLLLSLGTGAVFTVVISTVSRWFTKNRGFALGITQSGGSLGAVVIAPLATYLIVNLDWRTALMIMGAAIFIIVTSTSLLLRKDPADSGLMPDGVPVRAGAKNRHTVTSGANISDFTLSEAFKTSDF